MATACSDHTVRMWSLPDLEPTHTLTGHQKWVWDCAFSADSTYIITGTTEWHAYVHGRPPRRCVASPPLPLCLSGSSDQSARLWELSAGTSIKTYAGHLKAVTAVALNDAPV